MIELKIDMNANQVVLRLNQMQSRLRSQLHASIAKMTEELLTRVRAAEPVRSGKLRRETQAFVDDKENLVRGRVRIVAQGNDAEAAGALEYGAHRPVFVKQHETHVEHVFKRVADRQLAIVDAYTRRANITAERFLRGPLAALQPRIKEELERVVSDTVRG